MSWEALNRQLRRLVLRFLAADNAATFEEVYSRLFVISGEGGELSRLQASGLQPSPAEAESLRTTLAMAADRLAALDSSIPSSVNSRATVAQVSVACQLFNTCFLLCTDGSMPDMLGRFLPCATLLLRPGAAAQQYLVREVQHGAMQAGQLLVPVTAQLWAFYAWQHIACREPPAPTHTKSASDAAAAAGQAHAPPALLQQWLQCTLASMRLLEPTSWKPGTAYARTLVRLSQMLGRLFTFAVFSAHGALLLRDAQLCRGLLQLVLPSVSAMAVGLQLPPDRRPPECSWEAAVLMAAFVSAALQPMQQQQQQQAITVGPDEGRRLLTAAAQLLQCCPFPAPSSSELTSHAVLDTTLCLIQQLEAAAMCQYPGITQQPGQQPTPPTALALPRSQAQLLLAALPRISEALAAAVAHTHGPQLPQTAHIIRAAATVAALLSGAARPVEESTRPAPAMAAVQDLPAWLRAAAAALRWLPSVFAIWEREQPSRVGSSVRTHSSEAANVAVLLAVNVGWSTYAGMDLPDAGWAACSAEQQAECLAGLWELHTVACRVAHAVLAGVVSRHLVSQIVHDTQQLFQLVEPPFVAASAMCASTEGVGAALPPEAARCLPAMAVAYSEALFSILDACAAAEEEISTLRATLLLGGIATALLWGPPALANDVRLQAAAAKCLGLVPQADMLQGCDETKLLELAAKSPRVAAVLVAEGLPDKVLQAAQASLVDSNIQLTWRQRMMPALNQLLTAAEGADQQSAAAGEPGAAAAAVAEAAATVDRAIHGIRTYPASTASIAQLLHVSASWLPPARRLAAALLAWWRRPEAQPAAALELAQAAAARSCAYLRCANLGGEGGPAAGQGDGSLRCSACHVVWYCGTACSHADWRAGHRRVCKELGAARAAEQERQQQAAAAEAAAEQDDAQAADAEQE
ncbi:hypothetical protein COHA_007146 [Chlorella ohadii]|uniref:MYND-type domain-containing protein n=1 Tax=Chlorella ohadii TaxID=2649997 RepID=A0AAD5DML8_9CHLO|nr:hypothetical protein COHA_007146 [Chlorella ohadii]